METNYHKELEKKLKESLETINSLKLHLSLYQFSLDTFRNNDAKTKFFTGLSSFKRLELLFEELEVDMPYDKRQKLNNFEVFILTLMRLRFGLSFRFLAYRFNVDETTVSKFFHKCLFHMFRKLRKAVHFPSRTALKNSMPLSFREQFDDKITIILDCFEIFCETSQNNLNAIKNFSNYKHHQTVKYLIGITPSGSISFISEAFGGRSSDKFITENCGILDKIEDGDVVMCDRGFLIEEVLEDKGASLVIPAFMKARSQLDPIEVEETRNIANVRIHVEREIGTLREKYPILKNVLPMCCIKKRFGTMDVTVLDQMVTVCCALINLCPSIITK